MTTVVDLLVEDRQISVNTPIYVCTMANNQIDGEDLGETVANFHFTRAIDKATSTVLVVDRMGDSLRRTWCGLEVHWTLDMGKSLQVYTPSGLVGGPRASSEALIEQVQRWDVKDTQASDDSYRRQIFNFIGKVPEKTGLQVTEEGKLRLDKCRPMIDDDFPNHERMLFDEHGKDFEELNRAIRQKVTDCVGKEDDSKGCPIPDRSRRGVKVGQWNTFVKTMQSSFPEEYDTIDWFFITENFLLPFYREHRCSYVEYYAKAPQTPRFYVTYARLFSFKQMAAAISWFVEAQKLSDSAVLHVGHLAWIDDETYVFDNGLTKNADGIFDETIIEQVESLNWMKTMRECEGLVFVLNQDKSHMSRLWRLIELEMSVRLGLGQFFATNTGVISCQQPFPGQSSYVFGSFDPSISRMIMQSDIHEAKCTNADDTDGIHAYFHHKCEDFFHRMNRRLRRWCAGPALLDAASKDDTEEIKQICKIPGLLINSDTLKGPHSESAIHIAAALGKTDALRALIELKANPNVEDDMRESPLHYAAISGQHKSCEALLCAGADPLVESSFGETPLQVAKQNLAGYLGVETDQVCRVLLEAERKSLPDDDDDDKVGDSGVFPKVYQMMTKCTTRVCRPRGHSRDIQQGT